MDPTTGCDRVSEGCDHCYALTLAGRLKAMGNPRYQRDGDARRSGPGFGLTLHADQLDLPLRWRKPRLVFVDSMSDLFHADVPDEFIAEVFGVMAVAGRYRGHVFQVLTKRPGPLASLLNRSTFRDQVASAAYRWAKDRVAAGVIADNIYPEGRFEGARPTLWPLPNVWLGTSVETQKWADVRIPKLLETPAAVRFLSCEPLLGAIDLRPFLGSHASPIDHDGLGWVIIGGESGPGARPMELGWGRSLVKQCQAAGVPVFVKQLGSVWANEHYGPEGGQVKVRRNRKGGEPAEWPKDLRVREMPGGR